MGSPQKHIINLLSKEFYCTFVACYNLIKNIIMNTITLPEPKNKTKNKKQNNTSEKKMSMWDYMLKFKEKPLIKVFDEDLVFGSNMWPKLLQEDESKDEK